MRDKKGVLKNALYKDESTNSVYCVPIATEGAKLAVLEYKTLDVKKEIALVEIKLITGRSHQARVQLATAGTPIFGDAIPRISACRGRPVEILRRRRQAVHNQMIGYLKV